jgi:hypothetical protein
LGYALTPLTHRVDGFPILRLLCPFRLFPVASGFRWALAYLLSISLAIHREVSRVRHIGLKQYAIGGVFLMPHPLFVAPQHLHGV